MGLSAYPPRFATILKNSCPTVLISLRVGESTLFGPFCPLALCIFAALESLERFQGQLALDLSFSLDLAFRYIISTSLVLLLLPKMSTHCFLSF
jgi:hypothetical protein